MEPLILSGPTRVFVKVARKRFDRDVKRAGGDDKVVDVALMKDVVRFASGDPVKAFHLGTAIGERRVMILFEYENDEHDPTVKVIGFRIKRHIKPLCTPASVPDYIKNSYMNHWLLFNEKYGCRFPHRSVTLPAGAPNPWAPRPTKQTDGQGGESSGQGEKKAEEGESSGQGEKKEEGGEKKEAEGVKKEEEGVKEEEEGVKKEEEGEKHAQKDKDEQGESSGHERDD